VTRRGRRILPGFGTGVEAPVPRFNPPLETGLVDVLRPPPF